MLSQAQKAHFATFGFLVLRRVFAPDEIAEIRRAADRVLAANRQGRPFSGACRQAMIPFFEHSPRLLNLLADDRLHDLAHDLLGPGFVLNATEGNLHVGDTHWHGGDETVEPLPHIKIAFYLEPTTKDTGALRLIPGSNHPEFRRHLQPLTQQNEDPTCQPLGLSGADLPCQVVETEPGDLVVFPETTWHAAFGGPPGRSQHAVSFMARPTSPEHMAYLRQLHDRYLFSLHPHPALVKSDRPRLKELVAPLVELGFTPPRETPPFET